MPRQTSVFPGQIYGRLTILEKSSTKPRYFLCKCACGTTKEVFSSHLVQMRITSCGCYRKEQASKTMRITKLKHGKFGTKIYACWSAMMNRCYNPNSKNYKDYGARGVTVCERWHKFENFYTDMGDPNGKSIERIENNKGYSPENCKWATSKEQANNRRSCINITFSGKTLNITQWSELTGIPRSKLYDRLRRRNWTTAKALTTP